MYVSRSDLNNVQEPGDYPFRDGAITITFAEVATWKDRPGAQFQLMRKYPLQPQARYALGRQREQDALAPIKTEPFYESSNGDSWYLTTDPVSGAPGVMHRANLQSGGQVSAIEIDNFLRRGPEGPEHVALRQLIASKAASPTILIAYDLHHPRGEAYDELIAAIQAFGTWWHHLETVWIVRCAHTPAEIRDRLKSHIGEDDQLLVIDITAVKAQWLGINGAGHEWLKDNIGASA